MRILGIVWTFIVGVIYTAISLGVLSIGDTQFEKVVLAILVLIFINVNFSQVIITRSLITISSLLFNQANEFHGKEKDSGVEDLLQRNQIKYYINMFFQCVVWFFALISLINAL